MLREVHTEKSTTGMVPSPSLQVPSLLGGTDQIIGYRLGHGRTGLGRSLQMEIKVKERKLQHGLEGEVTKFVREMKNKEGFVFLFFFVFPPQIKDTYNSRS